MIHVIVSCLLMLFPGIEEPDRSTPEKAFQGFFAVLKEVQTHSRDAGLKADDEMEKIADFCRTDDLMAKRAEQRRQMEALMKEAVDPFGSPMNIVGRSEETPTSVKLHIEQKVKHREYGPSVEDVKMVETTLKHFAVMEHTEGAWRVREMHRACGECYGRRTCETCRWADRSECPTCRGTKKCAICNGEGTLKEDFEILHLQLIVAEKEPAYSTGLGDPKSAAQSYADVCLRQDLLLSRHMLAEINNGLPKMRPYLPPAVGSRLDEMAKSSQEEGKKMFASGRPSVQSVDVTGDTATAVIVDPFRKGQQNGKIRIVLKKRGDRWLADAEQYPCWNCQEAGAKDCPECQGSGWR